MEKELLKSTQEKVALSDIDLDPGPFCMSFNFSLEQLKACIEEFSVLNPPYLMKDSESHYTIVAGYRRLLAVRELGWSNIVCQVLHDSYPPLKALLLNLYDNLIQRKMNEIEKAMVLKRLTCFVERKEIIKRFMPMLGIPANKQTLRLFLGLEGLEEPIKVSIAVERLSLRVAGSMMSLGTEDRLKINELFTTLKWSFNQQWEAFHWIIEIASREGRSIEEVINDREVTEILHDSRMSNPQKLKDIVKVLKRRRFPSLMKAETEFTKSISALPLPQGVKISPPPSFEGIDYRIEIVFTKGKELSITAKSVIIAAGSFSSNKKLLNKYFPSYNENVFTHSIPGMMGDGLRLAEEAGAALDDNMTFVIFGPHHYPWNRPPNLVDQPDTTITETQYLTFTLAATDPDGDSISFSSPNLPNGLRSTR